MIKGSVHQEDNTDLPYSAAQELRNLLAYTALSYHFYNSTIIKNMIQR